MRPEVARGIAQAGPTALALAAALVIVDGDAAVDQDAVIAPALIDAFLWRLGGTGLALLVAERHVPTLPTLPALCELARGLVTDGGAPIAEVVTLATSVRFVANFQCDLFGSQHQLLAHQGLPRGRGRRRAVDRPLPAGGRRPAAPRDRPRRGQHDSCRIVPAAHAAAWLRPALLRARSAATGGERAGRPRPARPAAR